MKFLSVSDLHGKPEWIEWILGHSSDYDAILFPGDLIDGLDQDIECQYIKVFEFIRELARKGIPVIYCSGNHDMALTPYLKERKKDLPGISFDNEYLRVGEYWVRSHPYSFPANLDFTDCHILLHHEPPEDSPVSLDEDGETFGSYSLRARLEYGPENFPPIILCGHQHYTKTYFWQTGDSIVCNSGQHLRLNQLHYFELEIDGIAYRINHLPSKQSICGKLPKLELE